MIILVDMDDVLADFEGEFITRWKAKHPDKICFEREERKVFGIITQYTERYPDYHDNIRAVYTEEGFFSSLPPLEKGIKAITEMLDAGHEVYLCTAPIQKFDFCIREKYLWVEKFLGYEWTKRLILTRDKTLIKGDYLIDDNPEIKGAVKPDWEHIIFDQPYNRHISDKRRVNWDNWKEVIRI
jgi:5'-nucleotidase